MLLLLLILKEKQIGLEGLSISPRSESRKRDFETKWLSLYLWLLTSSARLSPLKLWSMWMVTVAQLLDAGSTGLIDSVLLLNFGIVLSQLLSFQK